MTTAVIVTYNRRRVVEATIDAVLSQTLPPNVVVVVDNCSSDDTETALGRRRDIQYLRAPNNGGFAAGLNMGMAAQPMSELFWLLDDDSQPAPTALAELQTAFGPTLGILGLGKGAYIRHGLPRWRQCSSRQVCSCDAVLVDCALVRGQAARRVGQLRGDFFMMHEDFEWTTRFPAAGWGVAFLGANDLATRGHLGAGGSWRAYYQTRNHVLMARERKAPSLMLGALLRLGKRLALHPTSLSSRFALRGAWDGIRGVTGRTVEPNC